MNFFKNIVKTILKALFSACIVNFLLFVGLIYILASSFANVAEVKTQEIKKNSILYIDTSMGLSDVALDGRLDVIVSDYAKMSLLELYERIVSAGADSKIKAIFVYNTKSTYSFNLSQTVAVKKALLDFKKSGKKVYIYLGNPSVAQSEYYLASIADEVWINPKTTLDFSGIALQGTFLGNAFEKYGIKANIVKCGDNKSFGDMFTRSDFAPQNKKDLEDIAIEWNEFLSVSACEDRGVEKDVITKLNESNPMPTAQEALELNLVDSIAYRDQVDDLLGRHKNGFSCVNIKNYKPDYSLNKTKSNKEIAIVYMTGSIVESGNNNDEIGAKRYCNMLKNIRNNDNIKAVVLDINSGGGSAFASEQIRREVELLAATKPTIAYVTSMCASGAYWIATACDKIYTQETSLVGSIGVFAMLLDVQKLAGDWGVTFDVAKSSKYADILSTVREPSPEELALVQVQVDSIYNDFVSLVAKSRNIEADVVKQDIATGSIWTAKKAMELGLIDCDTNNLPHTIKDIAQELNLGDNYSIATYPAPKTYNEFFRELFSGESSIITECLALIGNKEQVAIKKTLSSFEDANHLYLRTPILLKDL